MQEMQNWSLGGEDSLEKEMATHSSILAWRIPWAEEPGGLLSVGSQSQTWLTDWLSLSYSLWGSHGKCTGMVRHFLFQWITFCQNSPLWSVHIGWPYMAWLIASPSYRSSFATTRSWYLNGVKKQQLEPCMEQLIGSRLRKECDRAVCCHRVFFLFSFLTYMLNTS